MYLTNAVKFTNVDVDELQGKDKSPDLLTVREASLQYIVDEQHLNIMVIK